MRGESVTGVPDWARWTWGLALLAAGGLVLAPGGAPEGPPPTRDLVLYDGAPVRIEPLEGGPELLFPPGSSTAVLVVAESCPATGLLWRGHLAEMEGLAVDRRVVLDLSGEPRSYAEELTPRDRAHFSFAAFPRAARHLRVRWVPLLFVVDPEGEIVLVRRGRPDPPSRRDPAARMNLP